MSADRWNHLSRGVVAALLERPERFDEVPKEAVAPGPARRLFDLMARRRRAGLAIDWTAIRVLDEALEVAGGDYIADLMDVPVSQTSLTAYVQEARDLGLRASLGHAVSSGASAEALAAIVAQMVGPGSAGSARPEIVTAADVQPDAVRWWWRGRLALGKLTVLEGEPDVGKSTILLDLAARVSRGHSMPDGTDAPEGPGDVVILAAAEDGVADTIVPRLTAAGADLARVHVWRGTPGPDGYLRGFELEHDLAALEAFVAARRARLIVVDALMAAMPAGSGTNRDPDTRRLLHPFASLAERTGAVAIVNRHHRKGAGKAIERGGGSVAIGAVARAVLAVVRDDDDETGERRLLGVVKANLLPEVEKASTAYRIVGAQIDGGGGRVIETSRIDWLGSDERRIRDLLHRADDEAGGGEAKDCATAIRELLADGPRSAKEAETDLRGQGFSASTIRRARERVGITRDAETIFRDGFGPGGVWMWRLPGVVDDGSHRCSPGMDTYCGDPDEHLSENGPGQGDLVNKVPGASTVGAHRNGMSTYGANGAAEQVLHSEPGLLIGIEPAQRRQDPDDPEGRPIGGAA